MTNVIHPFGPPPAEEPGHFRERMDASRQGEPATERITFKTAQSFVCEYEPIAYLIDGIVASGKLYTLTAKTGAGKTGLNVAMSLAVAADRPDTIGRKVEKGRVAYLACENADDARMRLAVTAFANGIDLGDLAENLVVYDGRDKPEQITVALEMEATKRGPFSLVLIDTFAAFFDGKDVNNPVEAGEFMRRLRPLTRVPGRPAVVVAAHPTKNAADTALTPYGAGAILNEVDGNLTLCSEGGVSTLYWQGKLRGLDFKAAPFKFELLDCPDITDTHGHRVKLPVMLPSSAEAVEERRADEDKRDQALLRAMFEEPGATQERWGEMVGQSKGRVNGRLNKLKRVGLVASIAGKWMLTTKGQKFGRMEKAR